MMQRRPVDEKMIEMIKGSNASRGLEEMKVNLALIQSACILALEGTTRATASEISARAMTEFQIEATPSFTGQFLANLQIATVTSHGKSRFVLEHAELEEIRKGMVAKCEEQVTRLKESLKYFHELPDEIEELQEQWQEIIDLRKKEREYILAINEERSKPSQLPRLEEEARKVRERASYAIELENECRELSKKIRKMPSLEEKKKELQAAIKEHEARFNAKEQEFSARERETAVKEKQLEVRESQLAERIKRLQKRAAWAELADLQYNIDLAKERLRDVEKEISRNQSFLDRLLRRKAGEG